MNSAAPDSSFVSLENIRILNAEGSVRLSGATVYWSKSFGKVSFRVDLDNGGDYPFATAHAALEFAARELSA